MVKHILRVTLLVSAFVFVVGLFPAIALAHNGEDHTGDREARQHEATTLQGGTPRLDDAKKRVCEARAQNINAIMTRSVFRAENLGKLLATITERVKTFGATLSLRAESSDMYVNNIAAAQAAFDADFATLKAAAIFSCDSDDPKAQVAAFQEAHRTVMDDIKVWRTAVKDFVGFLKSASEVRE